MKRAAASVERTRAPLARGRVVESAPATPRAARPSPAALASGIRVGSEVARFRLTIGDAMDRAERAADAAATQALAGGVETVPIERSPEPERPATEASSGLVRELGRVRAAGGLPLPDEARRFFEARYGEDLSAVRVHDGREASALLGAVGARALTVGNDVLFAAGEYAPDTASGRALLAHELAHVVQARAEGTETVRRALPTGAAATAAQRELSSNDGRLEGEGARRELVFESIDLPVFKAEGHRASLYARRRAAGLLRRVAPYRRGDPAQVGVWSRRLAESVADGSGAGGSAIAEIERQLAEKVRLAYARDDAGRPSDAWVIEIPAEGGPEHVRGRLSTLARSLRRPMWGLDASGRAVPGQMQVDHIVELQLGNWGGSDRWANTIENMELLEQEANGSSGSQLLNEVESAARRHVIAWKRAVGETGEATDAEVRALLDAYTIRFESFEGSSRLYGSIGSEKYWTFDDIARGAHLVSVRVSDPSYLGSEPARVRVLLLESNRQLAWEMQWRSAEAGAVDTLPDEQDWEGRFGPFRIIRKQFRTHGECIESEQALGTLWLNVLEADAKWKSLPEPVAVPVRRMPGARYAGVLDTAALLAALPGLEVKGLSAITVESCSFDPQRGLFARGDVEPDYAREGDAQLVRGEAGGKPAFEIEGARQSVDGSIPADAIDPPGPITIIDSSVSISSDDAGVRVDGSIELAVRELAHGTIEASLGEGGFSLQGTMTADTELFRGASFRLGYDTESGVSGGAEIPVDTSRIPGLEGGRASIDVQNGQWSVEGSTRFRALGIEAVLGIGWSEETGVTVSGRVPIPDGRIPGVRNAHVEARVTRTPEGELRFGASGHGESGIAGLRGQVDVDWDHGVLTVEGTIGAEHRNLSGSVHLGVTNRALGEDGEPTGEPSDVLSLFGGGQLEVTFGRFLRGTAEVDITPAGELQVRGAIGLADELELFPRREVSRELFALDIDIPIAGIVVLGRGFGIFAFVGGGLDASASFGPAVLRDTEVSITFNPARPDDTVIEGSAELFCPARAGLRLAIRAGIGGSLVIADVRGGVEIGGELGAEAEARARLDVRWTPVDGLRIEALAEALARPVFRVDVSGFAEVNVALLGTVWETRYQLAGAEIGADAEVGVRLPILFVEGEPFEISFDDVEMIVPDVDLEEVLHGLLGRGPRDERD